MSALAIFFWIALSVGIGLFASSKGRSGFLWGAVSLMFSPLAAGVVLGLMVVTGSQKVIDPNSKSGEEERFDPDEHDKKCPDCAEYIKLEARVCRFCGYEFSGEEVKQQIKETKREIEVQEAKGSEGAGRKEVVSTPDEIERGDSPTDEPKKTESTHNESSEEGTPPDKPSGADSGLEPDEADTDSYETEKANSTPDEPDETGSPLESEEGDTLSDQPEKRDSRPYESEKSDSSPEGSENADSLPDEPEDDWLNDLKAGSSSKESEGDGPPSNQTEEGSSSSEYEDEDSLRVLKADATPDEPPKVENPKRFKEKL